MDNILRERRLRWLGHFLRMDHQRIPQQAPSLNYLRKDNTTRFL